jgi:CRISPR-associated protein Cmr6
MKSASDKLKPIDLPAELILAQAKAALTLLCRFGGVGAKGRKGFGSFADLPSFDLAAIKQDAATFRSQCGLAVSTSQDKLAGSPSLEQMLDPLEVPTGGTNYWLALDQLAAAAQQFAKKYKHQLEKKALGLPRRIGPPTSGSFRAGPHAQKDRHASPVLYHFSRSTDGKLLARVVAFPAAELPNLATSRIFLQELLNDLRSGLSERFQTHVAGKPTPTAGRPVQSGQATPPAPKISQGMRVKAKIVDDPKGKGRPFAEYQGRLGIIENVPPGRTLTAPEEIDLIIKSLGVDGRQITFKWPS